MLREISNLFSFDAAYLHHPAGAIDVPVADSNLQHSFQAIDLTVCLLAAHEDLKHVGHSSCSVPKDDGKALKEERSVEAADQVFLTQGVRSSDDSDGATIIEPIPGGEGVPVDSATISVPGATALHTAEPAGCDHLESTSSPSATTAPPCGAGASEAG